jgi:hypothetical protein
MTTPTTHTLAVPDAVLTYDIRRNESSPEPILRLIGSPICAAGFGALGAAGWPRLKRCRQGAHDVRWKPWPAVPRRSNT